MMNIYANKERLRLSLGLRSERSGLTLSEVLVSMLIMSVGVVSLATLFPISVLRTAQATQLTHAVFLRNNAEAFIESKIGLSSLGGQGMFQNGQIPLDTFALIDPLGIAAGLPSPLNGTAIVRTSAGATTPFEAAQIASSPDSWNLVFEDTVKASTPTSVTTSTSTTGIAPGASVYRVLLYDATGKSAVLRTISGVAGATISWGFPVNGFTPVRVRVEVRVAKYTYMLSVRKKSLPTVNNGTFTDKSWEADIEAVVFYNRSFKAAEETLIPITFPVNAVAGTTLGMGLDNAPGVRGVDDNVDGVTDFIGGNAANPDNGELGWPGSDDNRTIGITFTPNVAPFMKKGSYLLETTAFVWYRIVDFKANVAAGTAILLLDQDLRFSPNNTSLNAIFYKGIVDVFPLGSRTGLQ